jgi:mono/diheme cytochrome c family protein
MGSGIFPGPFFSLGGSFPETTEMLDVCGFTHLGFPHISPQGTPMKLLLATLVLLCAQFAFSQSAKNAQFERGRYLVQGVGMCGDCHTPRDEKGVPIPGKELSGAPIEFKPLHPMPWANTAPEIAGLPGWNDEEVVTFLITGKLNGKEPSPPMPRYRFSKPDARSIVAYLRSLGAAGATEKSASNAK